jgi:hypothetical protein
MTVGLGIITTGGRATMTLVVGKVTAHGVTMMSDTRQYDPKADRAKRSILEGTLKTTILWRQVAVASTGNIDVAQADIADLKNSEHSPGFKKILEHLTARTHHSDNEYLVAFAGPKRLFKIAGGTSNEGANAWIGDKAGFERFQAGRKASPSDNYLNITMLGPDLPDHKIVSDRYSRMQGVIEDVDVPGVGDFFTITATRGDTFRLALVAGGYFDAENRLLDVQGNLILGATGANKGSKYYTWTPEDENLSAAAFVFPEVKTCFIFQPEDHKSFADKVSVLTGVGEDDMAQAIRQLTGITFSPIQFRARL